MQQIDLNLLAQLAVLLQTRSVTQAAARLGVSQPALSRSLAELRRLFADPLLVRTRGGMLLTRRAEELVKPLQEWLAQAGSFMLPDGLDPARLERRFRIIAADAALSGVLLPAFAALVQAAPNVGIDVLPDSDDPRERLAAGDADLALGRPRADRHLIHDRLLKREELLCVLRIGHPLLGEAAARELFAGDFLRWPHIGIASDPDADPLAGSFFGKGIERRVVATLPTLAAAAPLLGMSEAVAFVPASTARLASEDRRLTALPAPAELGACEHWALWHNRTHRDPAVQWLVELLARHCQPMPSAANDLQLAPHILAAAE
jgi:DNA-binding transcriptional LysR family regulator